LQTTQALKDLEDKGVVDKLRDPSLVKPFKTKKYRMKIVILAEDSHNIICSGESHTPGREPREC
jgi:hypothetical protein